MEMQEKLPSWEELIAQYQQLEEDIKAIGRAISEKAAEHDFS